MKVKKIKTTEFGPTMELRIKNESSSTPSVNIEEIDNEILFIIQSIFRIYPYIALPYTYLGRAYRNKGTAAVSANGWLIVNPEWWNKITPEEKFFVIIHEILHAMLKHPIRGPVTYSEEYNIIADAIVNSFAVNTLADIINSRRSSSNVVNPEELKNKIERLSMRNLIDWNTIRRLFKENGLEPPQNLEKLSADEIFTRLYHGIIKNQKHRQRLSKNGEPNEPNQNNGSGAACGGSQSGSSGKQKHQSNGSGGASSRRRNKRYGGRSSVSMDRGKGDNQQGGNQSQEDQNKNGNGIGNGIDTSEADYENGPLGGDLIANYDPEKDGAQVTKNPHPMFDKVNDSTSAENAWRRIHNEAVNFQKLADITNKRAGTGAGSIEELISIIEGESKISWQKIIKETVREHYRGFTDRSYRREDRRYSAMQSLHERDNRFYMPGIIRYSIPDVHVTFDTSGSMTEEELRQILTEVYTIAKKFRTKIRVTQWDWDVQDDRIVKNPEEFRVFSVHGRGGTSIIPVLQYVAGERDFNGKKYNLQKDSLFIIFSDFELYDNPENVIHYLEKIHRTKRARFLFVNTKTFNVFDSKRLGIEKAFKMALEDS